MGFTADANPPLPSPRCPTYPEQGPWGENHPPATLCPPAHAAAAPAPNCTETATSALNGGGETGGDLIRASLAFFAQCPLPRAPLRFSFAEGIAAAPGIATALGTPRWGRDGAEIPKRARCPQEPLLPFLTGCPNPAEPRTTGPLGEQSCWTPRPDARPARKHPRGGAHPLSSWGPQGRPQGCAASWLFPGWLQLSSTDSSEEPPPRPRCDRQRSRGIAPSSPGRCTHQRVLPAPSPPAPSLCPLGNAQPCKKRVGGDAVSPTGLSPRSAGDRDAKHRPRRRGAARTGGIRSFSWTKSTVHQLWSCSSPKAEAAEGLK